MLTNQNVFVKLLLFGLQKFENVYFQMRHHLKKFTAVLSEEKVREHAALLHLVTETARNLNVTLFSIIVSANLHPKSYEIVSLDVCLNVFKLRL